MIGLGKEKELLSKEDKGEYYLKCIYLTKINLTQSYD